MNYQNIYNQIIERAKTHQIQGYKEKHHVVPKCLGGLDIKENLVELTAKEHFLCHHLLVEIHPKNTKLKQALWLMSIGKQKNKLNIHSPSLKTYERLKKEYSKMMTGTKQSEETKEKRKKNKTGFKYSNEISSRQYVIPPNQ